MFRSYIETAWRKLVKHRLNAFINILGLTTAFTCSILLFLVVYQEFSFDKFQKNKNQIFKLYSISHAPDGDKKSTSMGYPVASLLKNELPGIARATALMPGGEGISYKDKKLNKTLMLVDNDFFNMFSFHILEGNVQSPLGNLNDVVISKSTAEALFGVNSAIGKTVRVKIGNDWKSIVVSAVIEDSPVNSTISYDMLARVENSQDYTQFQNNWNAQNHPVYVELSRYATQKDIERKLRLIVKRYLETNDNLLKGYRADADGDKMKLELAPFISLHFDDELGSRNAASKSYLYTLVLIAIVVLVIACFNFINLNVAFAFTRAKEIGIRKVTGASKSQIFLLLWLESFLLCLMALAISLLLALMILHSFNDLLNVNIQLTALLNPAFILYTLIGMLLVSFLAGGYPAWLISNFKTIEVLKGKLSFNKSVFLRNGLITSQFTIASVLICSTLIIYRQFVFLRNAPLGFQQESVISIPVEKAEHGQQYLRELRTRLSSTPGVVSISASSGNFGIGRDNSQGSNSSTFNYKDKTISTDILLVEYDFLKTMGIKSISGRDFTLPYYTSDTSSKVINIIITQSVARQFGESNVNGLYFYPGSGNKGPQFNIIGIVPDFHLNSLRQKLSPVTMMLARTVPINYLLVKVKTNNLLQAMEMVSNAYKEVEPDNTIGASYLSENTQRWYVKEKRLSSVFTCSAVIAILLSCLGLFAIVSIVMQQRRKEIGMRKVLGASFVQLNTMLVKDFIKLVFISFLIATPIAWYFLNKWLMDFTYRIQINWWVFPLAGSVLIIISVLTVSFQTVKASVSSPVENLAE